MVDQNQTNNSLTFSDLELMLNILDAVTQRGAIKANEMATVGALYEKLSQWLKAHREELERQQAEKDKPSLDINDKSEGENND